MTEQVGPRNPSSGLTSSPCIGGPRSSFPASDAKRTFLGAVPRNQSQLHYRGSSHEVRHAGHSAAAGVLRFLRACSCCITTPVMGQLAIGNHPNCCEREIAEGEKKLI